MDMTPEMAAFERGVRPVLKIVLPEKAEAVLNFRPDPELLARIENNWLTNQQKGSSRKRKGPSTKVTCARTNS